MVVYVRTRFMYLEVWGRHDDSQRLSGDDHGHHGIDNIRVDHRFLLLDLLLRETVVVQQSGSAHSTRNFNVRNKKAGSLKEESK